MRIVFFIGGLSGGGAERVTCNLASHLANSGHYVTIMTMSDDESTYMIDNKVKRNTLLMEKERRSFLYNSSLRFFRLCKHLWCDEVDVYIVMLPITTIMLLQLRKLTKSKIIAAERVDPSNYSIQKQKELRKLAKKANGWIFQTDEERNWYGKSTGEAKVKIIPNAINPDFIKEPYLGKRKKTIVSAGRLTTQKNHILLIKAFAQICSGYSDYQLVIYGDGNLKTEYEKIAEVLGVKNKIILPGYTTNIGEKIKDASMFVLSSDYEGMPNALMEAMALGIPCVSTDCDGGGARFLIKNEKNGLLVPKGDIGALADAMDRMLSDRDFANKCGSEAHKICERLASEKIYSEWESFIKQVVECD